MSKWQGQVLSHAADVAKAEHELLETAAHAVLTREDVLVLMAEVSKRQAEVRRALADVASEVGLPGGGKDRILLYLKRGNVASPDELLGVAGIYAWARRVRELRDEGWQIDTVPGDGYYLRGSHPRQS